MKGPVGFVNEMSIDCVLRYLSRQTARHVYMLLELEVKRYLRNHTPYLKDPCYRTRYRPPNSAFLLTSPEKIPYNEYKMREVL